MTVSDKYKFAFFGSSQFSIDVLNGLETGGLTPSLIVTTPDKPVGRKKVLAAPPVKIWAIEREIPVLQFEKLTDDHVVEELKKYDMLFYIVASYGKIIPEEILQIPEKEVLNIHPSLLPAYRGATPIQSAIIDGLETSGVSIMLLDKEMDHGPILRAEKVNMHNKTYQQLEKEMAGLGAKLICGILSDWTTGKIKAKTQNHSKATFTTKYISEDGYIDSRLMSGEASMNEAVEAERKIRALNPEPGTYTILNTEKGEQRVKILSATINEKGLLPDRVIPSGKSEMSWGDFLKGNKIF